MFLYRIFLVTSVLALLVVQVMNHAILNCDDPAKYCRDKETIKQCKREKECLDTVIIVKAPRPTVSDLEWHLFYD